MSDRVLLLAVMAINIVSIGCNAVMAAVWRRSRRPILLDLRGARPMSSADVERLIRAMRSWEGRLG